MNRNVNGKAPEKTDEMMDFRKSPMMLISEISRLMGDKIREKCDDNPIQQKSGRLLLMELAKRDGRTQLDLVHATHLKAPTISVALQKMEKDGYVTRKPDEYDLRATRVFLTEKGREIDDRIRRRIREEEALAMMDLTESEYETLVKLLLKIKGSILSDNEKGGDLF